MNFTLTRPDGKFSWGSLLALAATMVGSVAAAAPMGSRTNVFGSVIASGLSAGATFVH